ncbi:hypothetical protein B0T24DRAFT_705852 [Lasiosphaeria ovina]|uniref:Uncharacterized protein n=1 Tax=Lasiosphaeria ovina TaxID=92902 RepID=A0AAE0K721_9PEZI|nr:hypothetical protein B0T24DRAFT_705852 [Lasiosphaeria ovina]
MYWENALFKIMPPYRKRNTYCKPLAELDSKLLATYRKIQDQTAANAEYKWATIFDKAFSAKTLEEVLDLAYGDLKGNRRYEKYTSTNFTNVLRNCGTVEFRRQGWPRPPTRLSNRSGTP